MQWKSAGASSINTVLRRFGATIRQWPDVQDADYRRSVLFKHLGIDLVLDVGANIGQYGKTLRKYGYQGAIVSFEPMSRAYQLLRAVSERDGRWTAVHTAVGADNSVMALHIAGNANNRSSSLLPMLSRHVEAFPPSATVGSEDVSVRRMDDLIETHHIEVNARSFMKVDTQGFEHAVLRGAPEVLKRIGAVELELSLVPLYEGQLLLPEMLALMADDGFSLRGVARGFFDKHSGELLQVDGIFVRAA